MDKAPRAAVIMPAYNASAFIEKTINSLMRQSFEDFELIVVNDGSKDDTAEKIARLAEKDGRIRLISTPNGGPANARNIALDAVQPGTEFIMFMDSDDEYIPTALETAVNAAGSGADIVIFGFTIVNADGTTNDYFEPRHSLDRRALGERLAQLYKSNVLNQVWAKLFRAELIIGNNIRFEDWRWGEDRLFMYDCLEKAQRIEVLPDCNYHYIMHEGESLISRFYDKKLKVAIDADKRMTKLCGSLGVVRDGDYEYMFIKNVLSCMTNLFSPSCPLDSEGKRAYVRDILENEYVMTAARKVSGGAAVRGLCLVMRSGSVSLNLAAAKFMTLVGKSAPKLFLRLKHKK